MRNEHLIQHKRYYVYRLVLGNSPTFYTEFGNWVSDFTQAHFVSFAEATKLAGLAAQSLGKCDDFVYFVGEVDCIMNGFWVPMRIDNGLQK